MKLPPLTEKILGGVIAGVVLALLGVQVWAPRVWGLLGTFLTSCLELVTTRFEIPFVVAVPLVVLPAILCKRRLVSWLARSSDIKSQTAGTGFVPEAGHEVVAAPEPEAREDLSKEETVVLGIFALADVESEFEGALYELVERTYSMPRLRFIQALDALAQRGMIERIGTNDGPMVFLRPIGRARAISLLERAETKKRESSHRPDDPGSP